MDNETKAAVTVVFKDEDQVRKMDALVAIDHSSRAAVLRKALDLLAKNEGISE